MSAGRWTRALSEGCFKLSLVLLFVRLVAPAPDAADPPDMHAFYHTWMQPPWPLIAALFGAGLLLPWLPWLPELYRAARALLRP